MSEETEKSLIALDFLKKWDEQRTRRFADMFIMPAQDSRYKQTGKYDKHVIAPVETHHVESKSPIVDTAGTVIELF